MADPTREMRGNGRRQGGYSDSSLPDTNENAQTHKRRLRQQFVQRYKRNVPAVISLVLLVLLVLVAAFADAVAPYSFSEQALARRLEPPSSDHWFGTDAFGRDVLSRLIVGSRVSIAVGLATVLLLVTIGTCIGLLAGYYRYLDGPLMRIVDLLMALPPLFLLVMLVALFGAGTTNTVAFIAVTYWRVTARYVRGEVLSIKKNEYMQAAIASGSSDFRILLRHVLPNIIDGLLVIATLSVSFVILLESALSFLGLGAQPPTPSWGGMLADGRSHMRTAWWITVFPGAVIFLTVMSFNFVGDGLRDAFDSRSVKDA